MEFERVNVVVFNWNWYGCDGDSFNGCVYFGSCFPCVGKFDVVMCRVGLIG